MAILDNRTLLSGFETGDTLTQPDDLTGSAGGTADTEIFIQGTRSWGYYSGSTRDGLLYDAGSAQNWSNNTFYFWVNCGVAGLLDTLANGGMAARFCGATVSDWFEVNIAGSDSYPAAIQGGWVMFVVDIEKAKSASDRTNGTPPLTSAIRYAGITTITPTMPRMVDNTWLDACWRLPSSTPGILVEGQNTGSVDWTFADIASTAESGAWGTFKNADGGAFACNTPIRFGANDAVTHGFSDTNAILLWEDWDVATSFYGIEVIGGSGTQSFQLGSKTGTGDDATGSQGGVISAASTGERWYFDADDANVDACNIYGATFAHGGDFQLDDASIEVISTTFLDCSSATITGIGAFVRNQVVDANTADGVAFLTTDDMSDIVYCSGFFSDGHFVELVAGGPAAQTSKGNRFSGYGATTSNDAAIYNNSGATAKTITLSEGALLAEHTYRNGASASTTVVAGAVTLQLTVIDVDTTAALQNARVLCIADDGGSLTPNAPTSITRSGSTVTVSQTAHGMSTNDVVRVAGANQSEYNGIFTVTVSDANTYTYTITGTPATPATGGLDARAVLIDALTSVAGQVSDTRSYASNQPFTGTVRLARTSPAYKPAGVVGTVNSSTGATATVPLIGDE